MLLCATRDIDGLFSVVFWWLFVFVCLVGFLVAWGWKVLWGVFLCLGFLFV